MKQQDNHSPSKVNSTNKDLNTCIEEEISNTELQKSIVKMIIKLKEEMQNLVSDFKNYVNI
jgi:hypothetical protein